MSVLETLRAPFQSEDQPEPIDIDAGTALDLLKNERRRLTIHLVAEAEREGIDVTLSDIAEALAMAEQDCERHELGSQERKRCYVALYQTHVPRLCEHGVIGADDPQTPQALFATEVTEAIDEVAMDLEARFTGERLDEERYNHDFADVRQTVLGGAISDD